MAAGDKDEHAFAAYYYSMAEDSHSQEKVLSHGRTDRAVLRRPYVLLSVAVSLDGYLDAAGRTRLHLSSDEDLDEVDALRAASDAILIGAGTARRDDPRLLVRRAARRRAREISGWPPSPLRVVVTKTGDLAPHLQLMDTTAAATRVYCPEPCRAGLREHLPDGVDVVGLEACSMAAVLEHLAADGVGRLLVEGGEVLSTTTLHEDLADELRVAYAPVVVGDPRAPRFLGRFALEQPEVLPLLPWRNATLGNIAAIHYTRPAENGARPSAFLPRSDAQWLAEAIELSRRCPPSTRAYSVGAILVGQDGQVLSTGYSRELDAHVHAEEAAIRKAQAAGLIHSGACLYSSMEPCSVRLSGREPCTSRVLAAGIRRVVYALREPDCFVQCEGHATLERHGIKVVQIPELSEYAQAIAMGAFRNTGDAASAETA